MSDTSKISLSHYVELTTPLIKNQVRLVEECGYCISWQGDILEFSSVEEFTSKVEDQLRDIFKGNLDYDISVEDAMTKYGLL